MSEPIRILNLFTIMNRGGAETMVMNYYRNIDRTKVQFDFLVHRQERGAYDDEIEAMGGRIYRMCPIYPQNFGKYKKMLKVFFDEHPEYKILHSHMSELGCYAFIEAQKRGIKVKICHAHNAPCGFDIKALMRDYFKLKIRPFVSHMFVCGNASGIWLFGKENASSFIQVNNAIDSLKYKINPACSDEVKKELGIEKSKTVIGHIGRFNTQKNHEFLIDIFSQVHRLNPDSVLVLVGNGTLENKIKDKVKNLGLESDVLFLGVRDDVNRIIQCFDVFLFPSLFEGLGIVLIEAQAAGVPCLTSEKVVAKEACITDLLEYYPLNESSLNWAKKTLELSACQKRDTTQDVIDSGFDIKSNAQWLQDFYINEYNKNYKD